MVYFAGKAIERVVKLTGLTPVNKGFGVFFSVLKMIYFISVFIILIESYDEKSDFFPEKTKEESILYSPIKKVSTATIPGILRAKEIADSLGIDANDALEIKEIHDKYEK